MVSQGVNTLPKRAQPAVAEVIKQDWKENKRPYWIDLSLVKRVGEIAHFFQFIDLIEERPGSA